MRLLACFLQFLLCCCNFSDAYRYVVTTYTGDRFGAGTDARVFFKLFGSNGKTDEKELKSSGRDNFERGQIDTFLLDGKDVGRIKKAEIRHDNSWLGPGWYLEKLTATSEDGDYYEFPVHKWLDKHQDDGKTIRELVPKLIQKEQISKKDEILNEEPRQPLGN
ncbi:lipoxygenase homology domain-containing protein 1-like [Hydractinia symbiolongicarpus]|uniref:lipoxygenase homology domain-containing protein 1-like n=1 Tax=Hydractinia symbiolongicarpus TaxID=13093 RepID=UPI0025505066|nr:lipoxygenase homology domain-containing protein 1-like [Hydractinia symbiolongicarpus]